MLPSSLRDGVAGAAGALLGAVFRGAAAVRPAPKVLHPSGRVRHGRLFRRGAQPPTGVAFLDAQATDDVVVRESRAMGLPGSLPDIHGLAVRIPNPDGSHGDLLFATTGFGRLTRFLLTLSRTTYGRPMTTLLPYDTAAGPVLLGAHAATDSLVELSFAVGEGEWQHFADLVLSERDGDDQTLSFDPVLNRLPGLEQYAVVRKLREPSYDQSRSSRGE